jgi:hypothetical protein
MWWLVVVQQLLVEMENQLKHGVAQLQVSRQVGVGPPLALACDGPLVVEQLEREVRVWALLQWQAGVQPLLAAGEVVAGEMPLQVHSGCVRHVALH